MARKPIAISEINVRHLKEIRDRRAPHLLVDVREPSEYAACRIAGSKLIPLAELPMRLNELPKDQDIIIHCHHGGRSAQAVRFLQDCGFSNVKNLAGGIDAWSCEVDPTIPRY